MKPEFGKDLTNILLRQSQIVQTRMAGRAVIRVVERCENAQQNNILNLSQCQLCQVPDAVYHLMREVKLTQCDLSGNDITKITKKFPSKFPAITELNLSHNKISKLPDELADCKELTTLDISHNSFVDVPKVLFMLPKIKVIKMSNNYIMDVDDCARIPEDSPVEEIDVRENPLTESSRVIIAQALDTCPKLTIHVSPREKTEWDDL